MVKIGKEMTGWKSQKCELGRMKNETSFSSRKLVQLVFNPQTKSYHWLTR